MSSTTLGSSFAAVAKLMRGNDTVSGAAREWEAEASQMRAERDAAQAELAELKAKFEPFDDAMGEIFSLCLEHLQEDIEIEVVSAAEEGTEKDCAAVARNVLRIVRAALAQACKADAAEGPDTHHAAHEVSDGAQGWSDDDFHPADMSCDELYCGTRKYLAIDRVEKSLDETRADALQEAIFAVNCTAAPVVGTPYAVGGRLFAEAIRARLKISRLAASAKGVSSATSSR